MKYQIKKIFFIALIVFGLSACVTNNLYVSRGSVEYASGETSAAVIYWRMDKGRLYSGAKYEAGDSGISLRICKRTTKEFVPDEVGKTGDLVLLGKSGDLQVSTVDAAGNISILDVAVPVNPQNKVACGRFIIEDKNGKSLLNEGNNPEIIFMCNNLAKVNHRYRYPKAKKYTFGAVKKSEYKESDAAPDACVN
ncbi:hypothetical protein MNBD_GAMMA06-1643 [hydrothermal vent metagenome]|uniref:Lipoprotein n=1 Tax=hydrothermal vent metagenome TaxID=652676 RepID=A0A3B0W3G0_9ZZZZ